MLSSPVITVVLLLAMSAAILLIVFMPELDKPRNDEKPGEPRQEDPEPEERQDQADVRLAA